MDYEQKYKEALDRAKKWRNAPNSDKIPTYANRVIEEIFPELKESEDEKIRKAIILFFELQDDNTTYSLVPKKDILAWLEKQGGKKSVSITDEWIDDYWQHHKVINPDSYNKGEEIQFDYQGFVSFCKYITRLTYPEKQGEQKLIDKVESKFKVGDWVVYCGKTCEITGLGNGVFTITNQDGSYFFNQVESTTEPAFHLWTIEDAKDGDVLANDKSVFIYAKVLYNKPYAYCGVDKFGVFKDNCSKYDWSNSVDNIHPATKEQRDILFQKMKEAGYEWHTIEKELI